MVYNSESGFIQEKYKELLEISSGAKYVKCDLHVHSPESKCYVNPSGISEAEKYDLFIDQLIKECSQKEIKVIAVTDHNTIRGYEAIRKGFKNRGIRDKDLYIIPGIEITTSGRHVIALFRPPKFSDLESFIIKTEDFLVSELKIDRKDFGKEQAATGITADLVVKKIREEKGYAIAPHIFSDTGLCGSGSDNKAELKKAFRSKYLSAVMINKKEDIERLKIYCNDPNWNRTKLPVMLKGSDCHNISDNTLGIGFWMKCESNPYRALELGLAKEYDENRKEIIIWNKPTHKRHSVFIGIAFNRGKGFLGKNEGWNFIKFSEGINLLYGERGTGKTTVLEMLSIFGESDPQERYHNKKQSIFDHYEDILIFHKSVDSNKKTIRCYRLKINGDTLPNSNNVEFWIGYNIGGEIKFTRTSRREFAFYKRVYWTQNEVAKFDNYKNILNFFDSKIIEPLIGKRPMDEREIANMYHPIRKNLEKYLKHFINKRDRLTEDRTKIVKNINKLMAGNGITTIINPKKDMEEYEEFLDDFRLEMQKKISQEIDKKIINDELRKILEYARSIYPQQFYFFIKSGNYRDQFEKLIKFIEIDDIQDLFSGLWNIPVFDEIRIINTISGKSKDLLAMSGGQKSSIILQIILLGLASINDDPILLDQPEIDLDTQYIFQSLSNSLLKIAQEKQIIFATHSPQLPIPLQPDKCFYMSVNGMNGTIKDGYIDNKKVLTSLKSVLEGGDDSFSLRAKIYKLLN